MAFAGQADPPGDPLQGSLKSTFDQQGFAGPFPLADIDRARRVLAVHPFLKRRPNPHTVSARIAKLLADENLVGEVEALCGSDLMVWRSAFFAKKKGSPEIGWHHDKHFQTNDSEIVSFDEMNQHFSVLIALSDIDRTNGQIEVIPGTHLESELYRRDPRPYHLRAAHEHFLSDIPSALVDRRQGVDLPKGHFLVFHSALLHRSLAHPGGAPRVGLALRLTHRGVEAPKALAKATDVRPFGM